MNTDQTPLLYARLTYKTRAAIFSVYNQLGFGHKENVYHKALVIELAKQNLSFKEEVSLPVKYDNKVVGYYRPDFTVDNKVIIEIKALPVLPKSSETQLIYYLKGTDYKVGLLVNFGSPKLQIIRKVWSKSYNWKDKNK